jgi:LuxR family maltose regulon positive regulatory protein
MSGPVLATKLYIPQPRTGAVARPALITQLDQALTCKLTLISAPAGFGKTTLLSAWAATLAQQQTPLAWLSLDDADADLARFLRHLIAALQTVDFDSDEQRAPVGQMLAAALQGPQLPPLEALLTPLLNELSTLPGHFALVLDDYHVIHGPTIDQAIAFLIEHGPPQLHLVIATRADPSLPLSRLRARHQLLELRAAELRFTPQEAAHFFRQAMRLDLSDDAVAALEARTEGWAAGLQLAALSLQRQPDADAFIAAFQGSHRFVLDYLVEEVLEQQTPQVQRFLLQTALLERLCGPLCEAVLDDPAIDAEQTLHELERANLFLVPLDNERRWYRYHHLFADLLRQRFSQQPDATATAVTLQCRASAWHETQGMEVEAFRYAVAAGDVARAARLVEGDGMPLLFRGAVGPVLDWLDSLPASVMNDWPGLWVLHASAQLFVGRLATVEETLAAAEVALRNAASGPETNDLIGHIAAIRAAAAVARFDGPTVLAQSQRALAHLHPDNLPVRTATTWSLGVAHELQGDRAAAGRAYANALTASQAIDHYIITIAASIGLGGIQEGANQLRQAAATYADVLAFIEDAPLPIGAEAHLGLARIHYEWNDLPTAEAHGRRGLELAQQLKETDRAIACQLFLARLALGQGDEAAAASLLREAEAEVRHEPYARQAPTVAELRIRLLLRQAERLAEAERLAHAHDLPVSRARVQLAKGDAAGALALLEPMQREMAARDWADEALRLLVLQALATFMLGDETQALHLLEAALAEAAPAGFVRLFVDEGAAMAALLTAAQSHGIMPDVTARLRVAFAHPTAANATPSELIEPLTDRELEVLALIAQGLSNAQISERLFLALSTVKGHNRNIFGKLAVQRRTEAVARARALGLV